jgi:hypothetical protein
LEGTTFNDTPRNLDQRKMALPIEGFSVVAQKARIGHLLESGAIETPTVGKWWVFAALDAILHANVPPSS